MLVLDVPPQELVEGLTEELKTIAKLAPPAWAEFAKTGISREFPPTQEDWWYRRAASIMRKLVIRCDKPVGVGVLREQYGGRQRRGVRPSRHAKGSGHIIRTILQQLQDAQLVEIVSKEGRNLTTTGKKLVNKVAREIKARHPELQVY